MNTLSDSKARELALDTQQSFAVSAPAGSGKTGLLTQRVLALLAKCEHPENVLAITFTKKAAAEMQERIIAALNEANTSTAPEEDFKRTTWDLATAVLAQDKKQQWQLLQCPNRLRITTIDSFCRQLSQQSPLNHSLGDAPEILDDPSAAYLQAARDTLALLESDEPIREDLIVLIKHFNNQLTTIEELMVRLLSKRDQWLPPLFSAKEKRHYLESTLKKVIEDHLTKTQQQLHSFASDIALLADYAASNLSNDSDKPSPIKHCLGLTGLPNHTVASKKQWEGICELLLTKDGKPRNRITKNEGFPAASKTMSAEEKAYAKSQKDSILALIERLKEYPEAITSLAEVNTLPAAKYSDNQWHLLDSLTRVLHRLVAQLYLTFQANGKTDYIEITLAALEALGEPEAPTDLSLLLDYRLQHILVDEFQDTSSTQLSLLEKLTAGWQTDDGRTLFVVGDAMQSCYRFRNANVGLFLDIKEHGLGDIQLNTLNLEVNFRSDASIVNWVNTLFAKVFPGQNSVNEGAVKYNQATVFLDNQAGNGVSFDVIVNTDDDNSRSGEAKHIVSLIKNIQTQNNDASIAILVRSRMQVAPITRALKAAEIAYRATDIDPLANHMVIQDLLSLTKALLYPHDRIAWLALLRAPWCGLDMYDLHTIANAKDDNQKPLSILDAIYQYKKLDLSPEADTILASFCEVIEAAFVKQQRCMLRHWIEGTWQALGGESLLLENTDYPQALVFFDLLHQHDNGGRVENWAQFLSAIESLYAKPATIDSSVNTPIVDIMTIHKSKGLEFEHVLIPGLDRGARADSSELLEWMERIDEHQHRDLLISPVHATGDQSDEIYGYIRQQSSQKQALESDRVFYVGCTRAIDHLYLIACAGVDDKKNPDTQAKSSDDIKIPGNSSTLATIWPHIATQARLIVNTPSFTTEEASTAPTHPNIILRKPIDWRPAAIQAGELLSAYRPTSAHNKNSDGKNRASNEGLLQRHARYFGTILHEAIQQLTLLGDPQISDQQLSERQALWQSKLIRLGTPRSMAQSQSQRIYQALSSMLKTAKGRWLLDHTHQASACEKKIYYAHKQEIRHSIIDRTFIDVKESPIRWIIDYKSSEPKDGQSIEEFAIKETEQYKSQMAHYGHLFSAEPHPVKMAIYFPLINHFTEVTP